MVKSTVYSNIFILTAVGQSPTDKQNFAISMKNVAQRKKYRKWRSKLSYEKKWIFV